MNTFDVYLADRMPEGLCCDHIEILQVNIGRNCNLACAHCHLDCSPARTEMMGEATMDRVVKIATRLGGAFVDITGGEPTLHARFVEFVTALRNAGKDVQVRTNLTALLEPGLENMTRFLCEQRVAVVASMPCYLEENVRAQRGKGVYEASVKALQTLNALGYGMENGLPLDLVYNPGDAVLPGGQSELEAAYREEFWKRHGISFTHLFTIINMPIGRFRRQLERTHQLETYMHTLKEGFNAETLDGLMCRRQICVDWDGRLYDCDFNLALGCAVNHGAPDTITRFDYDALRTRRVVTGEHCFGCTAGAGSSCGGALSK